MGIPNMSLPELRPVQTESPMDQYAKALQIRQMQGQNQLQGIQTQQQQQALKDQQAGTAALHEWDGQDPDQLMKLMAKNGASINAVLATKQHFLDTKAKYSQIAKDDAETGAKNLETMKGKNDMMVGALNTVMGAPDEQIVPTLQSTAQDLVQRGLLDPQHAQQVSQMAGLPPDQIRQKLKMFEKSYMSDTQQIEQATKEAQAYKDTQQGNEAAAKVPGAAADSQIKQAEAGQMQQGGLPQNLADMKYRTLQQSIASGQPIGAGDKAFIKAYEKQKLLVPVASANIRMEGMGKIRQFPVFDNQTKQTVYMDSNEINDAKLTAPGRFSVPSYTPEAEIEKQTGKTFGPGGKGSEELLAFNTALQHAELLKSAYKALDNGDMPALNKIGNALGVQFGSNKATNAQLIGQVYAREVTKAVSAGHITDNEIKEQGATLPTNGSREQQLGAIDTYKALMQSKASLRQKQLDAGRKGQVFGADNPQGGQQQAAPQAGGGWAEQFGGTSHK